MNSLRRSGVLISITILAMVLAACGGEPAAGPAQPSGSTAPGVELKLGETANLGGVMITLKQAEFKVDTLQATLLIENQSKEEVNISPNLNFAATDSNGRQGMNIMCQGVNLATTRALPPGDKQESTFCWFFDKDSKGIKLAIDLSVFGKGKATFIVTP